VSWILFSECFVIVYVDSKRHRETEMTTPKTFFCFEFGLHRSKRCAGDRSFVYILKRGRMGLYPVLYLLAACPISAISTKSWLPVDLDLRQQGGYFRSFVLIPTLDNGSEPKKVCKRCDDGHLRGGSVASAFYRRGYTLCDRLSALPYWLSDGCIVSATTLKGGQLEGFGAAGLAGGGTGEI
jgi:hypothetical protein